VWVKDLEHLGRPLEHTLIIDYDRRIYCKQPQNGIEMRWVSRGLKKDKGLLFLCQILQEMVSTDSLVSDTLRIYAE
jgi:TFIIF-interacting CTD phosphatase-like protein